MLVFIGDSTGQIRTGVVATDTYAHKIATQRLATYLNKCVPGDKTSDMLARFDADVVANIPKWVIITAGHNDAYYSVSTTVFESNIRQMIEKAKRNGIGVVLNTAAFPKLSSLRTALLPYNAIMRRLASTYQVRLVDIFRVFAEKSVCDPTTYNGYYNLSGGADEEHFGPTGHTAFADIYAQPEFESVLYLPRELCECEEPPPEEGEWLTAAGPITTDRQAGWSGCTVRNVIAPAQISNTGRTQTRLFFKAGTSSALNIGACYIGWNSTGGYGFEATPVQVTKGGLTSFSTPLGTESATDAIDFEIPASKYLVVAWQIPSGSNQWAAGREAAQTGYLSRFKAGADASNMSPTGYSNSSDSVDILTKIEVRDLGD